MQTQTDNDEAQQRFNQWREEGGVGLPPGEHAGHYAVLDSRGIVYGVSETLVRPSFFVFARLTPAALESLQAFGYVKSRVALNRFGQLDVVTGGAK